MSSPEQLPQGPENGVETPRVTPEMYDRANPENNGERLPTPENAQEKAAEALAEAKELSLSVEKAGAEKDHNPSHAAPIRRRGVVPRKEKREAFKERMADIQSEMPLGQRTFSRFIHSPVVERVSETLGSTVARPNAILAGSVVAFVLVLAVLLVAKHFGYALSGFETIGAFVAGWVIGLLYDFFKTMITGKR